MNSNRKYVPIRLLLVVVLSIATAVVVPLSTAAKEDDTQESNFEKATFAGGCFWCMEPPFDALDGVISTTSGYTGGHKVKPTYKEVSAGSTGHTEAVQIVFDPAKVSFDELLDVFWRNIDPTTSERQFCDQGSQYRPGIFYHDDIQKALAESSRQEIEDSRILTKPNVTEIVAVGTFYPAEDYHQNYYKKNPLRYKFYRSSCGRDRTLEQIWGEAPAH